MKFVSYQTKTDRWLSGMNEFVEGGEDGNGRSKKMNCLVFVKLTNCCLHEHCAKLYVVLCILAEQFIAFFLLAY